MNKLNLILIILLSVVLLVSVVLIALNNRVLINVCKDNKWGYINKNGKVVIPFEYDWTGLVY